MLEKFNLGDRVYVSRKAEEYGGSHGGKVGFIKRVSNYHDKYGVELKDLHNDLSENGVFWFGEESLFTQEEIDKEKTEVEAYHKAQTELNNTFYEYLRKAFGFPPRYIEIKKVIFNNPATIVFWSDGKKTVVKCADNETFDEEKGLAMAISKRVLGNMGNYYNEFKKWLPEIEVCEDKSVSIVKAFKRHECNSCAYLETPPNDEPCVECVYYNSKYKPKKETKINGRYL